MQQFQPRGFSFLPLIVKNLLIINGIFFLATIVFEKALNIDLVEYLGMHYFGSPLFKPYQIITYMFMHDPTNFMHIAFNMFALWMFGNAIEISGAEKISDLLSDYRYRCYSCTNAGCYIQ